MSDHTQLQDLTGGKAAGYFDRLMSTFPRREGADENQMDWAFGTGSIKSQFIATEGLSATLYDARPAGEFELEVGGDRPKAIVITEQFGGSVRMSVDGISSDLSQVPGDMTMALANEGRSVFMEGNGVALLTCLVLEGDHFDNIVNAGDHDGIGRPRPLLFELRRSFEALERACRTGIVDRSLNDLAVRLAMQTTTASRQHTGGLAPWQLHRVSEHVRQNLYRGLLLRELAAIVRISQAHFSRAFKASTGLAPHQWILTERCRRAKELMVEGNLPLADIAFEVGFSDQSHFTRSFGRLTGVGPGAWRRDVMPS